LVYACRAADVGRHAPNGDWHRRLHRSSGKRRTRWQGRGQSPLHCEQGGRPLRELLQ
jgi:hypothetical protein